MADKDKQTQARIVPKTSQAPDPPAPIRGSHYSPQNTPARYEYWNRVPAVTVDQFTYLILGCEPDTELVGKERQRRNDLLVLVRSHQVNDTFPRPIDSWAANPLFRAVELIEWADPMEYEAPNWKPMPAKQLDDTQVPESSVSVDVDRFKEALSASKEMRSSDKIETPTSLVKHVLPYMQDENANSGRFKDCCDKNWDDSENLARSIRRGGKLLGYDDGSPLKNSEYLNTPDVHFVKS